LKIEKTKKDPTKRVDTYLILYESYEDMKKQDSSRKYTELYNKLSDSLNQALAKTTDKRLDSKVETIRKDLSGKYNFLIYTILAVSGLAVVLIWLYWKKKNHITKHKYEELLQKLKTEENSEAISVRENYENTSIISGVNISSDTLKDILQKLDKFEKSNRYLKKEVSRSLLASQLNTNPYYLTEIIKQHKNKSFTSYINGLKIKYIIRQLHNNPVYREYKISYLAEECGYSSAKVFLTAFKNETGLTPSYFIENLKKDALMGKL
jgi:AraC-like DNA-binding protein